MGVPHQYLNVANRRRRDAEAWVERLLERHGVDRYVAPARAVRLIEFTAVGVTGVAVNVAVFLGVIPFLHFVVAGTIAFYVSVSWNFVINRAVTFDRPDGHLPSQYGRYLAVHVVGFVVYIAVLGVTIEVLSLPYVLADLVAVTLGGIVNFVGAEIYAFSMHRSED